MLKLIIPSDGRFIFKQIAPVERRRLKGRLAFDPASEGHVVLCGEEVFRVLPASISFFKGQPGDEVILLIPKAGKCVWAAVEHIARK